MRCAGSVVTEALRNWILSGLKAGAYFRPFGGQIQRCDIASITLHGPKGLSYWMNNLTRQLWTTGKRGRCSGSSETEPAGESLSYQQTQMEKIAAFHDVVMLLDDIVDF